MNFSPFFHRNPRRNLNFPGFALFYDCGCPEWFGQYPCLTHLRPQSIPSSFSKFLWITVVAPGCLKCWRHSEGLTCANSCQGRRQCCSWSSSWSCCRSSSLPNSKFLCGSSPPLREWSGGTSGCLGLPRSESCSAVFGWAAPDRLTYLASASLALSRSHDIPSFPGGRTRQLSRLQTKTFECRACLGQWFALSQTQSTTVSGWFFLAHPELLFWILETKLPVR